MAAYALAQASPAVKVEAVTVTPKAIKPVTVTSRMAEMRKRKAEAGLIALTIWAHPDNHAKIKDFAKTCQS